MHMEGLIQNGVTFSGWSVETGPKVWQHREVWYEIEDILRKNDIETAAVKLRRYLEYLTSVLANSLRADVRFKGDGQYDLGDLMQPVINRWREKFGDANKAAKSWGRDEHVTALSALQAQLDDAWARTQTEQWAVNPATHNNQWANFQADEFRQVVRAFADLLATLQSDTCKSSVELQPRNKQAEHIRCNCGGIAINLKKKTTRQSCGIRVPQLPLWLAIKVRFTPSSGYGKNSRQTSQFDSKRILSGVCLTSALMGQEHPDRNLRGQANAFLLTSEGQKVNSTCNGRYVQHDYQLKGS